MFEFFVLLLL